MWCDLLQLASCFLLPGLVVLQCMRVEVFLLAGRHASVSKFALDPADSWGMCKFRPGGVKRAFIICVCFKVSINSYIWLSISCLYFFMGQAFVAAPTDHTVVSHDPHNVRVWPEGFFCPHETSTVCWPCYVATWLLLDNISFFCSTDCACKTSHNVIHRSQKSVLLHQGRLCPFIHVEIHILLLDQQFCIWLR